MELYVLEYGGGAEVLENDKHQKEINQQVSLVCLTNYIRQLPWRTVKKLYCRNYNKKSER